MPNLTAAPSAGKTLLPSCALFGAALVLFGVFLSTPAEILRGMYVILTTEDVLITDYIAIAGMGAAFVNAGLVTLISVIVWSQVMADTLTVTLSLLVYQYYERKAFAETS